MIYKKLKIKNNEEAEELDINDIEVLDSFGDARFKWRIGEGAIVFSYKKNILKNKVARLSKKANWIIREYDDELYLIALKKDC